MVLAGNFERKLQAIISDVLLELPASTIQCITKNSIIQNHVVFRQHAARITFVRFTIVIWMPDTVSIYTWLHHYGLLAVYCRLAYLSNTVIPLGLW